MIRSSITICLVPEAREGPFVFHDGLERACARAAELGFDAVEVFPRSADEVPAKALMQALEEHHLQLAAMGTGAGWLTRHLSLTSPDPAVRGAAIDFIGAIVDLASRFGAPAIIGSMQGWHQGAVDRAQALAWLGESLDQLGARAQAAGVPLLLEPLNRYESNLCRRLEEAAGFLKSLRVPNIKILADLYHMNIEERDLAEALRAAGSAIGHVHFADSNRRAVGFGHTDLASVAEAIVSIGYHGFLSAEIYPWPDADTAARQTLDSFRRYFRS